jgi:hypothetical protein
VPGVLEYKDFYAIHDHMPGGDHSLRVGGTVVFRTSGWSAELRPLKKTGPTGINPLIFYLELVLTPPPDGTAVSEVITPFDLPEFRYADTTLDYNEVQFKVVGSPDEEPVPDLLKVQHPQ